MRQRSGRARSTVAPDAGWRASLAGAVLAGAILTMLANAGHAEEGAVTVVLKNHEFVPVVVHVRAGQAIRFDNADDVLHSLTLLGRENVINEEFVDPGQSYTVRIPEDLPPGTYELACTIHVEMRGRLSVGAD